MKKINFFLLAIAISTMAFLTPGCSKEKGCTDPDSINFNTNAEEDDGSCLYRGRAVFWYGQTASEGLIDDDATNLTFYVDGQVVGSTATSVYWATTPDCGDNASITVTKDLGSAKTQVYSYSVKDQTGFEYWAGTQNFNANTCIVTELTW